VAPTMGNGAAPIAPSSKGEFGVVGEDETLATVQISAGRVLRRAQYSRLPRGRRPWDSGGRAAVVELGRQQSQRPPRVGWAQSKVCFFATAAASDEAAGSASSALNMLRGSPAALRGCSDRAKPLFTAVRPKPVSSFIGVLPFRAT
jgi:hypothetical protein